MKRQIINLILCTASIVPHSAFAMDEYTINRVSKKDSVLGKRSSSDSSDDEQSAKRIKLSDSYESASSQDKYSREHFHSITLDSSTANPQAKAYANLQLGEMYMFGVGGEVNEGKARECFDKLVGNADAREEDRTKSWLRLSETGFMQMIKFDKGLLGPNFPVTKLYLLLREYQPHESYSVDKAYWALKSSFTHYLEGNYSEAKKGFNAVIDMVGVLNPSDQLLAKLKLEDMNKQGL